MGIVVRPIWCLRLWQHPGIAQGDACAVGRQEGAPDCNAEEFARQHSEERGFFVSLHELTSTYPTLSRRVADLASLADNSRTSAPKRHPLAYLLAFFVPPGGGAAPASLMITIVVIGMLAAMAIPAFNKVRETSQGLACANNQRMLSGAFDQHILESGSFANRVEEFVGPGKLLETTPVCLSGGSYEFSLDAKKSLIARCDKHGTIEEIQARRRQP